MKILIAEDDPLNLKLFSDIMELTGFEVIQAIDGRNVIELVQMHSPSVIILDLHLPYKSGLEIATLLKADPELAKIPVIAVSGFVTPGHQALCFKSGFDEYIPKPLSIWKLISSVTRLVNITVPNFATIH